jgi:hypothetical protein
VFIVRSHIHTTMSSFGCDDQSIVRSVSGVNFFNFPVSFISRSTIPFASPSFLSIQHRFSPDGPQRLRGSPGIRLLARRPAVALQPFE